VSFWVGSASLLEGIGSGRYQATWSGSIDLPYIAGIVFKIGKPWCYSKR
jgi:hypothetical protein